MFSIIIITIILITEEQFYMIAIGTICPYVFPTRATAVCFLDMHMILSLCELMQEFLAVSEILSCTENTR
jgi:hypothetical protein